MQWPRLFTDTGIRGNTADRL
jgi:hypothetical protein